jgi:hypothetical protein
MSELWKNERYFGSFEEAEALRKSLLSGSTGATLQVKIKRCGLDGQTYVVKSRTNPELKAAIEEVEERLQAVKEKKVKNSK